MINAWHSVMALTSLRGGGECSELAQSEGEPFLSLLLDVDGRYAAPAATGCHAAVRERRQPFEEVDIEENREER